MVTYKLNWDNIFRRSQKVSSDPKDTIITEDNEQLIASNDNEGDKIQPPNWDTDGSLRINMGYIILIDIISNKLILPLIKKHTEQENLHNNKLYKMFNS